MALARRRRHRPGRHPLGYDEGVISGALADRLGQRKTVLLAAVMCSIGAII